MARARASRADRRDVARIGGRLRRQRPRTLPPARWRRRDDQRRRLGEMPPSTSMSTGREPILHRRRRSIFGSTSAAGSLAAEARIDLTSPGRGRRRRGHNRRRFLGVAGLSASRPACRAPYRLQRAVSVRAGLRMDGDRCRRRLARRPRGRDRRGDHQMHVELVSAVRPDRPRRSAGADGEVRHEMAVHHVDMDPVRAGGPERLHLLAEAREIGREDRGGDDEGAGMAESCWLASRYHRRRTREGLTCAREAVAPGGHRGWGFSGRGRGGQSPRRPRGRRLGASVCAAAAPSGIRPPTRSRRGRMPARRRGEHDVAVERRVDGVDGAGETVLRHHGEMAGLALVSFASVATRAIVVFSGALPLTRGAAPRAGKGEGKPRPPNSPPARRAPPRNAGRRRSSRCRTR